MPRKPCSDAGHCRHLTDGQPYQRHSGQEPGTVATICCWCGDQRDAPVGANATAPGRDDPRTPHGFYSVNKRLEKLVIAPCADCEALQPKVKVTTADGVQWVQSTALGVERCEKHKLARETMVAS